MIVNKGKIKPSTIGPPRKFYRLNEEGEQKRKEFWEKWDFISEKCKELRVK